MFPGAGAEMESPFSKISYTYLVKKPTTENGVTPMNETMIYWTKPCIVCGESSPLELKIAEVEAYTKLGAKVQDAFPTLSADEREQVMTGTHSACWDAMFGGEDES